MLNFSFENKNNDPVCGLDEVGRAPLAGPVVAACVYIPPEKTDKEIWNHINDSKLITPKRRSELFAEIQSHSSWAIAEASAREVEELNIVQASFLAMKRAYTRMCQKDNIQISMALIDGHISPQLPCKTQTVIKGDQKSVSIAAASILAKVYRDEFMKKLAEDHPHYGWERNVGYPTREHLDAIDLHGITDHHRKTFAPVRNFIEHGATQRQLAFRV